MGQNKKTKISKKNHLIKFLDSASQCYSSKFAKITLLWAKSKKLLICNELNFRISNEQLEEIKESLQNNSLVKLLIEYSGDLSENI